MANWFDNFSNFVNEAKRRVSNAGSLALDPQFWSDFPKAVRGLWATNSCLISLIFILFLRARMFFDMLADNFDDTAIGNQVPLHIFNPV